MNIFVHDTTYMNGQFFSRNFNTNNRINFYNIMSEILIRAIR